MCDLHYISDEKIRLPETGMLDCVMQSKFQLQILYC